MHVHICKRVLVESKWAKYKNSSRLEVEEKIQPVKGGKTEKFCRGRVGGTFCFPSLIYSDKSIALRNEDAAREPCPLSAAARPKVTGPRPASLSPLNRSLPLDMNHASLSPPPQHGGRMKGKRAQSDHFPAQCRRPPPQPFRHGKETSTNTTALQASKRGKKGEMRWESSVSGIQKIKISCLFCVLRDKQLQGDEGGRKLWLNFAF